MKPEPLELEALLAALTTQPDDPTDGYTSRDLAYRTGWDGHHVLKALHRLAHEGRLEVTRVRRPGIDGRVTPHTVYRLKS
jgi:hypothetical protein